MDAKGFHHFYIGWVMLLVAFYFLVFREMAMTSYIIGSIGMLLCIDDYLQHDKQLEDPDYRSPLHRLYGFFYARSEILRWLNGIVDELFGRK